MTDRGTFLNRLYPLLTLLFTLLFLQACGNVTPGDPSPEPPPPFEEPSAPSEPEEPTVPGEEPPEPLTIESTLPSDGGGEAGVEYSFTFV